MTPPHISPRKTPPPVRIIALDLDGTLLASTGLVSPRNQAALRAAHAAGIEIVIATGRRHAYAMRQLRALTSPPNPVLPEETVLISSNGAVVRTLRATLLERSLMTESSCRRLFSSLGEFRNALVVTFDRVGPAGDDQRGALVVEDLAHLHASIDKWMVANQPSIERISPIEDSLAAGAPIQMMLCGTVDRMRRAEALLRSIPGVSPIDDTDIAATSSGNETAPATPATSISSPRETAPAAIATPSADTRTAAANDLSATTPAEIALHRTVYPARDLSIVDILPAGASKGAALARLAQSRGFTVDNVMAIGDNWNDLPMLHVAGVPVLMGNAPADLLSRARTLGWWITPTNEHDGVAHAIEATLTRATRLHANPSTPEPELAASSAL